MINANIISLLMSGGGLSQLYKNILDEATTSGYAIPSDSVQIAQNTMINKLKNGGFFGVGGLDEFYCYAQDGSADFSRINWANPSERCTTVNTINWDINGWLTPTGQTGYLLFAKTLSTQSVNYLNTDCAFGLYIKEFADTATGDLMGASSTVPRDVLSTFPSGIMHTNPENNGINFVPISGANRNHLIQRTASNSVSYWSGGILRQNKVQNIGTGVRPAQKLSVFRNLGQGAVVETKVSIAWSGGSMAGKEALFNSIIQEYLNFFFNVRIEEGLLELTHPTETYDQIKVRRQNNWTALKTFLNTAKTVDGTVTLPTGNVEVYFAQSDTISLNDTNYLELESSMETNLIVYPFTNRNVEEFIFDVKPGSTFKIKNVNITTPAKSSKYETYAATLKKSSNVRLIEITGTVRSDFWTGLVNGATVLYSWDVAEPLRTGVIASFDSGLKQITLTADMYAGLANDTSGNIGLYFNEQISVSDYNTYGQHWVQLVSGVVPSIVPIKSNGAPAASPVLIELDNVDVENFFQGITGTTNEAVITFKNNCSFKGCAIGLSIFASDITAPNTIINNVGVLTIEDCAYFVTGAFAADDPSYGNASYTHPNIRWYSTGIINLIDNNEEGLIQYSASGVKPILSGAQSYFASIIASGTVQRDIITSNSMPTVIDYFESDTCLLGGDTIINGGVIGQLRTNTSAQPPSSVDRIDIVVNNATINNANLFAYSANRQDKLYLEYNNVEFLLPLYSSYQNLINSDTVGLLKQLTLNNCTVPVNPANGGDRASNFIRAAYFETIIIDGLTVQNQDARLIGNENGVPTELIVYINNNSIIPIAKRSNSGGAGVAVNAVSTLTTADGVNDSFSGTTNLLKTSPFVITADGVSTLVDDLTGNNWSVTFDGIPVINTEIIATGELS